MALIGIQSEWRCKNCPFSNLEEAGDMFCQEGPPNISFVTLPAPGTPKGFEVQTVSGWPVVRPEQWCGKHPKRAEEAKVRMAALGKAA